MGIIFEIKKEIAYNRGMRAFLRDKRGKVIKNPYKDEILQKRWRDGKMYGEVKYWNKF